MTARLYHLASPATDSFENPAPDAGRRARERGCECLLPVFAHFFDFAALRDNGCGAHVLGLPAARCRMTVTEIALTDMLSAARIAYDTGLCVVKARADGTSGRSGAGRTTRPNGPTGRLSNAGSETVVRASATSAAPSPATSRWSSSRPGSPPTTT